MRRILIVDDNEDSLYYLQALLGSSGYDVHPARNGAEALECALAAPPDLIISDILMPVMDGFALCQRWRCEPRLAPIPFVFYTATYTDSKDREVGLTAGADEFLIKPMEPAALLQVVRDLLRRKEAGSLPDRASSAVEENVFLREYNAALVRKLEQKLEALDAACAKLEEGERRFRSVVEGAPEGIIVQADDFIRYVNPPALKMFGAEIPGQLQGQSFSGRIHPDYRPIVEERIRELREEWRVISDIEEQFLRLDGTFFYVEVTTAPFNFEGCLGTIVFFRDITQRKQADESMKKLARQIHQAQKLEAVGKLAGGIAHDFNNLLMVIRSNAETLQERLPPENGLQEIIQRVMKAVDRTAGLTRQLLAFSSRQVFSPAVLDMNVLANETANMLKRLIREDIELRISLAEPLWAIKADPDQIVQVLMNLCVNARDAMPQGGKLTIATGNATVAEREMEKRAFAEPGEYVTLSVSDTGTGISKDVQERMFEPFFTTKDNSKGTGLGLSTVYGIVKQSGGFIVVDTELGRGTCFTVYLPREAGAVGSALVAQAEERLQGAGTLLLVEDEESLRESLRDYLDTLGYTVLAAESGQQALALVGAYDGRIDLVITDVVMPKVNGRELSEILLRQRPGLKTLFMSGYPSDPTLRHGVAEDSVAFLQKPFSMSTLGRKVRELIGSATTPK
jgi:PAS domain S-box-containing protein